MSRLKSLFFASSGTNEGAPIGRSPLMFTSRRIVQLPVGAREAGSGGVGLYGRPLVERFFLREHLCTHHEVLQRARQTSTTTSAEVAGAPAHCEYS